MLTAVDKKKSVPCAGCTAPAVWEVWGQHVCQGCHAAWHLEPRFDAGAINAALGIEARDVSEQAHQRYCAEATKRTKAWLAARKTTARAA